MAGSDSLNGKAISDTYKDLLQVPNANAGVDGTLRTVMDGEGTESTLQVSTAGVKSTGTLESTGNLTVGGTLTLGGTAISSLEDGATADQTGAQIKTAYEGEADTNAFTDDDHTKLNAIAPSATANDTDANLKARANHTGTQAASTISDFDTEVANNTAVTANTAKVTNATHTSEVTGDAALTIADNVVDEANLKVSNAPTDGYSLVARSGETGGLKWESVSGGGGGGSGTVTSVGGTGTVSGLTLAGAITSSGDLTLGGTLSVNLASDVTGTLPAANGGTGLTAITTLLNSNTTASDVGLGSVEDTAISTWAGSSNVTTLGTVGTGTWQGTAIADSYVASASTWNAKQAALTFGIANTNAVKVDAADVADDEYARFTASGLESRSTSEVLSDIGASPSGHNHSGVYEPADSDISKTDVATEWTTAQNFNSTALTFDATQDWDLSTNQVCELTLTANTVFDAPTNMQDGGFYSITLIQDGTGNYTAGWDSSAFKWAGGLAPTITATANAKSIITFRSDGTSMLEVGRQLNVS